MHQQTHSQLREVLEFIKSDDGVQEGQGPLMQMLKAIRGDQFDTPRLACVLPPWEFEQSEGLSVEEQSPRGWIGRLKKWRDNGFREGKGWFIREERLFLICAQTCRLVPCGAKGQGYELRAFRRWVDKTIGGVGILLGIVSTTLSVMIPPHLPSNLLGELAGAGLDLVREEFTSHAQAYLATLTVLHDGAPVEQLAEVPSTQVVSGVVRVASRARSGILR